MPRPGGPSRPWAQFSISLSIYRKVRSSNRRFAATVSIKVSITTCFASSPHGQGSQSNKGVGLGLKNVDEGSAKEGSGSFGHCKTLPWGDSAGCAAEFFAPASVAGEKVNNLDLWIASRRCGRQSSSNIDHSQARQSRQCFFRWSIRQGFSHSVVNKSGAYDVQIPSHMKDK